MKYRNGLVAVAVCLASALIANVTTLASGGRALTVAERAKGADSVVVATAQSVSTRWEQNEYGDRLIVSTFVLDVEETFKGQADKFTEIDVEGGTLDGLTLRVSGQAVINPGDRAVFFLDRNPGRGVRKLHMRNQGVLKLDQNNLVRGSDIHLDDVRRVSRAAGK